MSDFHVGEHVIYQLCNARKLNYPFPHFYAEDVFPKEFYNSLIGELAFKDDFQEKEGKYPGRTFSSPEGISGLEFMLEKRFLDAVISIFARELKKRYVDEKVNVYTDLRLVRDGEGYQIGPHTDSPWKMVSLLFYLPMDGWHQEHGTSIYVPNDPKFRCAGGPHYEYEDFHRVATMRYLPNCCFGFWKTDNSFHGVEPIFDDFKRDVLLYNIYSKDIYLQAHQQVPTVEKE